MWARWFFYTLINCPVVMLLAVLLLYATGLMPPTDQNWEQTELVAIGALVWFVFSFVLQIAGWWTPIVQGVRRLEANPGNFTEELFSLFFKLVLVLAAVLSIIVLVTGCWRLTRSIRITDPDATILDHGDISQVRSP